MIPIWHQEDGKWYLIPSSIRDWLNEGDKFCEGDKLHYDPIMKCWSVYSAHTVIRGEK